MLPLLIRCANTGCDYVIIDASLCSINNYTRRSSNTFLASQFMKENQLVVT